MKVLKKHDEGYLYITDAPEGQSNFEHNLKKVPWKDVPIGASLWMTGNQWIGVRERTKQNESQYANYSGDLFSFTDNSRVIHACYMIDTPPIPLKWNQMAIGQKYNICGGKPYKKITSESSEDLSNGEKVDISPGSVVIRDCESVVIDAKDVPIGCPYMANNGKGEVFTSETIGGNAKVLVPSSWENYKEKPEDVVLPKIAVEWGKIPIDVEYTVRKDGTTTYRKTGDNKAWNIRSKWSVDIETNRDHPRYVRSVVVPYDQIPEGCPYSLKGGRERSTYYKCSSADVSGDVLVPYYWEQLKNKYPKDSPHWIRVRWRRVPIGCLYSRSHGGPVHKKASHDAPADAWYYIQVKETSWDDLKVGDFYLCGGDADQKVDSKNYVNMYGSGTKHLWCSTYNTPKLILNVAPMDSSNLTKILYKYVPVGATYFQKQNGYSARKRQANNRWHNDEVWIKLKETPWKEIPIGAHFLSGSNYNDHDIKTAEDKYRPVDRGCDFDLPWDNYVFSCYVIVDGVEPSEDVSTSTAYVSNEAEASVNDNATVATTNTTPIKETKPMFRAIAMWTLSFFRLPLQFAVGAAMTYATYQYGGSAYAAVAGVDWAGLIETAERLSNNRLFLLGLGGTGFAGIKYLLNPTLQALKVAFAKKVTGKISDLNDLANS